MDSSCQLNLHHDIILPSDGAEESLGYLNFSLMFNILDFPFSGYGGTAEQQTQALTDEGRQRSLKDFKLVICTF